MDDDETIPIHHDDDVVVARQRGRALACALGFGSSDQVMIATAISEVARNILTHGQGGEIVLGAERNGHVGIVIMARDRGPGIADVGLAMQDGYSTHGGLGLGLPGSRRLMDEFAIDSHVGTGTTVTMRRWRP